MSRRRKDRYYVVRTEVTEGEPLEGARPLWRQPSHVYSIWAAEPGADIDDDRVVAVHDWYLTAVAEVLGHLR